MPEASKDFQLIITNNSANSTDPSFTTSDLTLGDNYQPTSVRYVRANGEEITRRLGKSEHKISNQTLPRLLCQVFENELVNLSPDEKAAFPVCRYKANDALIKGIFTSVDDFKASRNSLEFVKYHYGSNQMLVLYSWSIFLRLLSFRNVCYVLDKKGTKLCSNTNRKRERAL